LTSLPLATDLKAALAAYGDVAAGLAAGVVTLTQSRYRRSSADEANTQAGEVRAFVPVSGKARLASDGMGSHEAARQLLAKYLSLLDEFRAAPILSATRRNAARELKKITPGVRRILYTTGPDLGGRLHGQFMADHLAAERTVARALRLLATQDEWEDSQDPSNPVLPSTELHPVVWAPACELWQSHKYRQAVHAAASAVNDLAQRRLERRDVSDVKLMQEAFSTGPPKPGVMRLRCPGDPADESVKSQQQGAVQFAGGCFLAMRNPAAHQIPEWNPLTAFEYLVAFSVLARWIDFWDLEAAPLSLVTPSPPPQSTQKKP
jgi:Protein of unknown function (Hypoth_ymh)